MQNNVFYGEKVLTDFLNPENHLTPLVELPDKLNPFHDKKVHIFLKIQTFLPLTNIKSISAWGLLHSYDNLGSYHTLVENSSGNTAFSLSVLGRAFGINRMKARVSNEVPKTKLQILQLFGVEPHINEEQICPNPKDPNSGIAKSRKEGEQEGWINPGQYDNSANPQIHYTITGKQIAEQLKTLPPEYHFKYFCAGLWTTGTFLGISSRLRENFSDMETVGVIRKPNNPIPWPRTLHLLEVVDFPWREQLDHLQEVGTRQAFEMSLSLLRNGFVVGPSSGMALCGLFDFLKKQEHLEEGTSCVVVCPDSPYLYIDEYFKYCSSDLFPKIHNKEKLLDQNFTEIEHEETDLDFLLDSERVWEIIEQQKDEYLLVDVRTESEYQHSHLKNAINLFFDADHWGKYPFEEILEAYQPYQNKKLILICDYGQKSLFLAKELSKNGFEAYSLTGGVIERSNLGYERERSNQCRLLFPKNPWKK